MSLILKAALWGYQFAYRLEAFWLAIAKLKSKGWKVQLPLAVPLSIYEVLRPQLRRLKSDIYKPQGLAH